MNLAVVKYTGESTGRKVDLSDAVFGIEPNDHAIWLDVKSYLANQRQGTHKSKERNEIAGSSKKIKKQKAGGGGKVGEKDITLFTRQLATMMKAGVPLLSGRGEKRDPGSSPG